MPVVATAKTKCPSWAVSRARTAVQRGSRSVAVARAAILAVLYMGTELLRRQNLLHLRRLVACLPAVGSAGHPGKSASEKRPGSMHRAKAASLGAACGLIGTSGATPAPSAVFPESR